jgi:hypothetical protein
MNKCVGDGCGARRGELGDADFVAAVCGRIILIRLRSAAQLIC